MAHLLWRRRLGKSLIETQKTLSSLLVFNHKMDTELQVLGIREAKALLYSPNSRLPLLSSTSLLSFPLSLLTDVIPSSHMQFVIPARPSPAWLLHACREKPILPLPSPLNCTCLQLQLPLHLLYRPSPSLQLVGSVLSFLGLLW